MKKFALILCGTVLALLAPSSLLADTIFNFSFGTAYVYGSASDYPYSGSGQLNTQATGTPGVYLITGATGTVKGTPGGDFAITGVTAVSLQTDNLLTVTDGVGTFVGSDTGGLVFDGGGVYFYNGIDYLIQPNVVSLLANLAYTYIPYPGLMPIMQYEFSEAAFNAAPTSPLAAATPEPGSFVLLATGGLGLIGAVRRRLSA